MKELINPWVIGGSILIALLILLGLFWGTGYFSNPTLSDFGGEAALTIIPNPTSTPTPQPTLSPPTASPESARVIQVGGYVKITGTEGEGLRLRQEPSLNGEVDFLGLEDEVFLVKDGPADRDGYLWWFLQAPASETRQGWAAANFLEVAQNP